MLVTDISAGKSKIFSQLDHVILGRPMIFLCQGQPLKLVKRSSDTTIMAVIREDPSSCGMADQAIVFYKRLASLLSKKRNEY